MKEQAFIQLLAQAASSLYQNAQQSMVNKMALRHEFKLILNTPILYDGLNDVSTEKTKAMEKMNGLTISEHILVDLLYEKNSEATPLWVNLIFLKANKDCITIGVNSSYEFVTEDQLRKHIDQYAPFHLLLPLP